MKKYDALYNNINNLLSLLYSTAAVELVNASYSKFNNSAPGELMQKEIDKLQEKLDKAED